MVPSHLKLIKNLILVHHLWVAFSLLLLLAPWRSGASLMRTSVLLTPETRPPRMEFTRYSIFWQIWWTSYLGVWLMGPPLIYCSRPSPCQKMITLENPFKKSWPYINSSMFHPNRLVQPYDPKYHLQYVDRYTDEGTLTSVIDVST